ncbi:glycosyltransferase family 4 protein [Jejuia pallidilutea]|uniref:Alpha-1,4-N-acetylgalactosamine transferase PglH n=3 Tax=Jejuia pallidilutea TaxID=504487 RepID=A0A098LUS5_9FLAO|nr:glycosyltransferase family 4 protein [Jejuia pallidilutea]GAL90630.1 alpha-1,4-N-acetylgalactosamine transferase PglH [Jejuia pallidilutea]
MKIDFAISSLRRGGGERVLVTIANNLVKRGHDVRIIVFIDSVEYVLDKKIQLVKLKTGIFSNETLRYTHELFKIYRKKRLRPDVLISFMTQTNLSAILVAKLFKIKVIASEHTNHSRTSTNKTLVDFTRKYIYRFANKITILTNYDLTYYKKNGCDVLILPNPCSFSNKNFKNNAPKEKTILAVGSLDKYKIKGFDNLLVLIAPILKKHKDWSLMFVGESLNNGGDFLLNLATNLKIQNQVIFAGLRDDVQQIMAKSEIFVLSSRTEGLPMVLIEAMSQNMCCIAYDCISGPSDIINHDVNGILIENQNTTDMASAINKVIENPELRKKLANKANEVLIKFDENLICDKWEYLIKNI